MHGSCSLVCTILSKDSAVYGTMANSSNTSGIYEFTTTGTSTEVYYERLKQPVYMIVIYSLAYSVVFLCALIGNLLVMLVVYRNTNMHTVTNYFIVNLAVADILVALVVLPLTFLNNLYNGEYALIYTILQLKIVTCVICTHTYIYVYYTRMCISPLLKKHCFSHLYNTNNIIMKVSSQS